MNESAFMAAIIANPADDAPRLIFADWLEENGQAERAEFIRIQCELANIGWVIGPDGKRWMRTGCAEDDALENSLRRRCQDLLNTHGYDWQVHTSSSLADRLAGEVRWCRGFIAEITCTAAAFAEHGAAILRSQPVEKVTLTENFASGERVTSLPLSDMTASSLREVILMVDRETEATRLYCAWLSVRLSGISVSVRGIHMGVDFASGSDVSVRVQGSLDGRNWEDIPIVPEPGFIHPGPID